MTDVQNTLREKFERHRAKKERELTESGAGSVLSHLSRIVKNLQNLDIPVSVQIFPDGNDMARNIEWYGATHAAGIIAIHNEERIFIITGTSDDQTLTLMNGDYRMATSNTTIRLNPDGGLGKFCSYTGRATSQFGRTSFSFKNSDADGATQLEDMLLSIAASHDALRALDTENVFGEKRKIRKTHLVTPKTP
ncbi:MAG: hypothetical protein OXT65_12735 [Alphaproteobacteria bacterium]|nr:hypothetical protein [Alphaproteobacteria bacterium]